MQLKDSSVTTGSDIVSHVLCRSVGPNICITTKDTEITHWTIVSECCQTSELWCILNIPVMNINIDLNSGPFGSGSV
jgi:hypothetical protein